MTIKTLIKNLSRINYKGISIARPAKPLLGFLLVVAIIIAYLVLRPYPYKVVSTSPKDGQQNIPIASNIVITFNQPIENLDQVQIILTPQTNGQIQLVSQYSQISFDPTDLLFPDTTYRVDIRGKDIKPYQFSFKTNPLPSGFSNIFIDPESVFPTLPINAPQDQIINAKVNLIATLPYEGENFILTYVVTRDRFLIKPTGYDFENAEQAGLTYIRSFGFTDPYKQLKVSVFAPQMFLPVEAQPLPTTIHTPTPSATPSATP